MKKIILIPLALVLSIAALSAQSAAPLSTTRYEIWYEDGAKDAADALGKELELRFDAYNKVFRFNPALIQGKLKVRAYKTQAAYDDYVKARVGAARPGAVYLHYSQADRRELITLRGSPDEDGSLPSQSFVQFLRAFIANPPSWMREGFAIYFNGIKYDPLTGTLDYQENLSWLETVKGLKGSAAPAKAIMEADSASSYPANFAVLSWALSSFFMNSQAGDYSRSLIESFMLLQPAASAVDNGQTVLGRVTLFTAIGDLQKDFDDYIASRRTFTDLVEDGRKAYESGDRMNAELCFLQALDQRPTHFAPLYYLGLIYYEEKNYDLAAQYFQSSLDSGGDEALVSYAMGLNAYSQGNKTEAASRLRRAASLDPARFQTRANEILQWMGM